MTIPATPTEMQAFIVEQLLHDGPTTDEKTDLKTRAKFFKQFGEEIETCLRDKVFHEIKITCGDAEAVEFQKFSETENNKAPVSLLKRNDGLVTAILRCDNVLRALLSRLFLGGDIGNPLRPSDKPATEIEVGLQDIFANFLSLSLGKTAQLECENSVTCSAIEFESDEVTDENAIVCRYEIQVDQLKCGLEIAVLDKIVELAPSNRDAETEATTNAPNLELMQSKVAAKVQLKPVSASLKSIQNLKVGDCLNLGVGGNLEGVFEVNGQSVYDCDIGRSGEIYCLKISDRSTPQDAVSPSQSSVG